ncbi:MAG: heavy metal translocating P-type ATPase [Oribacterium sp.]
MNKKQKKLLYRILLSGGLLLSLLLLGKYGLLPGNAALRFLLFMIPYYIIGNDILRKAVRNIRKKQVFDEEFLMAVATLGAILLALFSRSGDYVEAIAVMLFYQIGEWFQSYAVGRSRKNISELMDIRPDYANVEREGELVRIAPDELPTGSVIIVCPGEKVPIDGIVLEGSSSLNTAALTGESLPREIHPGEEIISGCINESGLLKIRTTKRFGESTVSKILELVENAGSRKSKPEDFITRFARVYTPAVVYAALALAVLPPILQLLRGAGSDWEIWLYRALSFLVASCPCALVVSIPLSFFAGIGGASHSGILVKGSNYLELLSRTRIVVFDKTGTLTQGVFEVNGIHHSPLEDEKLLEYAALAESASTHPISRSLRKAYGRELDRSRVSDIRERSGSGVIARVDGREVAAGNDKLMRSLSVAYRDCHSVGTIIHIAIDGEYAGHIVIADRVKPGAREAVQALRGASVRQTVMLTGDSRRVADRVAAELGIDTVYSQLLPGDKVERLETLLSEKGKKEALAFVGDGINDAPVLRRADIGIAMGAMGSDAAIEAADIVLMDDNPMQIAKAIRISRKVLRIVYENIFFSIAVKLLCLGLVALGLAGMGLAVFADVGVMILAVLNAVRALFVKRL